MIRRPPRSTQSRSSAASDVYKRQFLDREEQPSPDRKRARGVGVVTRISLMWDERSNHLLSPNSTCAASTSVTSRRAVDAADRVKSSSASAKWTMKPPLLSASIASIRTPFHFCLLYTSDAADDLLCVDLGGRR